MAEPPLGQHWPLNNVGKNTACSVSWTCSPGLCWTLLPACSWGHSPPSSLGPHSCSCRRPHSCWRPLPFFKGALGSPGLPHGSTHSGNWAHNQSWGILPTRKARFKPRGSHWPAEQPILLWRVGTPALAPATGPAPHLPGLPLGFREFLWLLSSAYPS